MKRLVFAALIAALGLVMAIAQDKPAASATTLSLKRNAGAETVWINNTAPPLGPHYNTQKPAWSLPPVEADKEKNIQAHSGLKILKDVNNMWYALAERIKDIKLGGEGDHYFGYIRFMFPKEKFEKVTLRFFVREYQPGVAVPEEIVITDVASTDLGGKETWYPGTLHMCSMPSLGTFMAVAPCKVGEWIEFDITPWVNAVADGKKQNHGFQIRGTGDVNSKRYVYLTGLDGENSPQLVYRK